MRRRLYALLALAMLVLSFIPVPISLFPSGSTT
jgi:hypothetical protein